MKDKKGSLIAENIVKKLPFPEESTEIPDTDNGNEPDYSLMEDNCTDCRELRDSYLLIDLLVEDILKLEEEMVRWRQALLRYLVPIDAQNLKSDIYDNLACRHSDNKSYQTYLKMLYNEQDPMESDEHCQMLQRLQEGTDETSIAL